MSVQYKIIEDKLGTIQGIFADTPDKSAEDRFIEWAKREGQAEEVDMTEFNVGDVPEIMVKHTDRDKPLKRIPVTSLGYKAYDAYMNGYFEGAFFDGEKFMWQDVWLDEHEGDPEEMGRDLKPIF